MEEKYSIDFRSSDNINALKTKSQCDKYDYLISITCGAIGGFIDIFFVGSPTDSKLLKWTDKQTDKAVMSFAKACGWKGPKGNSNPVASAISYLEGSQSGRSIKQNVLTGVLEKTGHINDGKFTGFKTNYDHRHSKDVGDLFDMMPGNHHLKSLAHQPDIIGLFFSILNQFTDTASFVHGGKLITIKTESSELYGHNFISKLFCGFINWLGHIMSDIAGASGSRSHGGRGSGIPIPFYSLFQFLNFGKIGEDKQTIAEMAVKVFENGYDFRFGLAMAIPVVITNLLISFMWSLRQFIGYKKPLKECIPISKKHQDLRVMLIFGNATICLIDGLDAAVRSGGNYLKFFLRLNLIAWYRLVTLVLKEVMFRTGLGKKLLEDNIEIYKEINEALIYHLNQLEKIDIELFVKETEEYNNLIMLIEGNQTPEEFNKNLLQIFEKGGLEKPWDGDFNKHMSNKNGTLVFK